MGEQWPEKTRDLHSQHFDSTIWDDFKFRDDDIIIATYAKSGATWTQQIIARQTTQRYAHLADDPRLAAADSIASQIAANMSGRKAEIFVDFATKHIQSELRGAA